jgi:hypothetical protein
MDDIVNNHKIAVISNCISNGLSPSDTAEIFRKHAAVINECCDALVADTNEKLAKLNASDALWAVPLLAAVPLGAGALAGHMAGSQAAKILTPRNEVPMKTYQKADEILSLKQETADILARVEERKRQQKERANDRSVRSIL